MFLSISVDELGDKDALNQLLQAAKGIPPPPPKSKFKRKFTASSRL